MTTVDLHTQCRPAGDILSWSRATFEPALRSAVWTLPAPMRPIVGYHLGWYDEHGDPASGDGGKAIRPALVLLAAEAVGADPAVAVPAAVAVELVHDFSLLHDDVMDGDRTRRHRATAWTVFGVAAAILAGDALLMLAQNVLATSEPATAREGMCLLSDAVQALIEGQLADVDFERRTDVELAECQRMAQGKTGALLGASCALGALFGGGTAKQVEGLGAFGRDLGLAFQHVDDLLGIWGDPGVTGKPRYSDLQNRKKSLPVVAALTSGSAAGSELSALYRNGRELSGTELARAAELIDVSGGRAWSQAQADELLARSLSGLASTVPAPRAGAELGVLAKLATRRDH